MHAAILTLDFCPFFPSQRCNNINLLKCCIHHRFNYLFTRWVVFLLLLLLTFCLHKESMYTNNNRKFRLPHGSPALTVTVKARMWSSGSCKKCPNPSPGAKQYHRISSILDKWERRGLFLHKEHKFNALLSLKFCGFFPPKSFSR